MYFDILKKKMNDRILLIILDKSKKYTLRIEMFYEDFSIIQGNDYE
jgi:hypothetical protein